MTNPIDKAAIRAMLAKTTPKPWAIGPAYTDDHGYVELPIVAVVNGKTVTPAAVVLQFPHVSGMQDANAAFIASARALVPALLDEIDRLHAELATQAAQIEACRAEAARWRYVSHTLGDYCVVDALDNTIGVLKGAALDAAVDAAMKEKTP